MKKYPPPPRGPPPGFPPPPEGPPPPGFPPPGFPSPPGGWGGGYFFIALPKAHVIRSSLVGAAFVKVTVSVGAIVVLIFGMSRIRVRLGGNIAFGASRQYY